MNRIFSGFKSSNSIAKSKVVLITGGAGFVGSHLVSRLIHKGCKVIVLDNFYTGSKKNIQLWIGHKNFTLIEKDVNIPIDIEIDEIYHLACPASPPHYQKNPLTTIHTSYQGTLNMLNLAKKYNAKIFFASTSEIYGDPEVHPQHEEYWGNVNSFGPRSCYDEGKRIGETLMYEYGKLGVNVRIGRIFNTFGPRMSVDDGRVVSNFIVQALKGNDITIYGDGNFTRSFQYVSDLITGIITLMESECKTPVNLGNPEEYTIEAFAIIIKKLTNSSSKITYVNNVIDDPKRRKPDITKAIDELNWKPEVSLEEGLTKTINYFKEIL